MQIIDLLMKDFLLHLILMPRIQHQWPPNLGKGSQYSGWESAGRLSPEDFVAVGTSLGICISWGRPTIFRKEKGSEIEEINNDMEMQLRPRILV
jgi:hypothetical protein